jgi:polar amino acid transport system substrate-binding protein
MQKILFFILLQTLVMSVHAKEASKETYKAVIVSTLPAPLLLNPDGSPEGLVKDYIVALGEILHANIEIGVLPRLRIDHELKYDLNCYTSYAWNDKPEAFYWSKPLLTKKEIIIGNVPVPKSLNDFKGESIGTYLGYKYPSLESLFRSQKLKREDTVNEDTSYLKLVNQRIPYIITDNFILNYYRKNHSEASNVIQKDYLVISEYTVQCALNRKSPLSITKLNKAIDTLITSKKLESILNKYR